VQQSDRLLLDVVATLEGDEEVEIVTALLGLRQALEQHQPGEERDLAVEGARSRVINVVNTFFHERLIALPGIEQYINGMQSTSTEHTMHGA